MVGHLRQASAVPVESKQARLTLSALSADDFVFASLEKLAGTFDRLQLVAGAALGPVDKVDSQISGSMIQDCLLGGGFGSRRPDGYGMADHRGVVAQRTWQEVPALAR